MNYSVIIVAAGSGSRMNLGYNKILYEIEPNIRVIDKSINVFKNDPDCLEIIVVLNGNDFEINLDGVTKILGGKTRAESVNNGLKQVKSEYVMIHDGARPFLRIEDLNKIKETLNDYDACLLAVKEKDTLKEVENGLVKKTIDRSVIYHAQTPQAFKTQLIKNCLEKALNSNINITDDVGAVELFSKTKIKIIEGNYDNIKLTVKEDLRR